MGQSRSFTVRLHWVNEWILWFAFRWLAQKKWYGLSLSPRLRNPGSDTAKNPSNILHVFTCLTFTFTVGCLAYYNCYLTRRTFCCGTININMRASFGVSYNWNEVSGFFLILEDISPFRWASVPLFRTSNVCSGFKVKVDPSLACFLACVQCIPHIYLWCNTCCPLDGQHYSWTFLIK